MTTAGKSLESATRIRVARRIDVSTGRVFDLLASPHRHSETDASGTVQSDDNADPITGTGQVFRMNMAWQGLDGPVRYQTDNHVDVYEPNTAIGWRVAPVDGEPLGWAWRYDLRHAGEHATEVTLTYDWTGATPENIERYGVPNFDAAALSRSLDRLAAAAQKG